MVAIIFYSLFLFVLTSLLGWLFHGRTWWNAVDVVYYPLAGAGVLLLFANDHTQRELLAVTQATSKAQSALQALQTSKPATQIMTNANLLEAATGSLSVIARWRPICERPLVYEPRCDAVEELLAPVDAFLVATRSNNLSNEERLLEICAAGDRLLDDIQTRSALTDIIGDELVSHYRAAILERPDPLTYQANISVFARRALDHVHTIHRLAFGDRSDESVTFVLAARRDPRRGQLVCLEGVEPLP